MVRQFGRLSVALKSNDAQAVLDELAALGAKPLQTLTVAQARVQATPADAVKSLLVKQGKSTAPEAVGSVEDRTIAGPGGSIAIRIYKPAGAGPFPVALYIHGGGWVIATIDTYDGSARALTNAARAIILQNHDAAPLGAPALMWFYDKYLPTPADGANPMFSVLRAPSLANLPSATVITADIDPLRSEGRAYAQRLGEAGVSVDYGNYVGVTHEFFGMGAC